jgi:hypothetical protein
VNVSTKPVLDKRRLLEPLSWKSFSLLISSAVGKTNGDKAVGIHVGERVDAGVGALMGEVGAVVGALVVSSIGTLVGDAVGTYVGAAVGEGVGASVGVAEGATVGLKVAKLVSIIGLDT